MNNEYTLDMHEEEEQEYYSQTNNYKAYLDGDKFYLTEKTFYSSSDDRTWKSNVEDIYGGDNFADYCEYIFDFLEEEGYYD